MPDQVTKPLTPGICRTCGNWTCGEYIDAIETASGGGAIIVSHGVGVCPGLKQRTVTSPRRCPR